MEPPLSGGAQNFYHGLSLALEACLQNQNPGAIFDGEFIVVAEEVLKSRLLIERLFY